MTLTPDQQRIRDSVRKIRNDLRGSGADLQTRLDLALAALDVLLAALDDDEEEKPFPMRLYAEANEEAEAARAVLMGRPVADHRPGGCECGGHVDAVGVFHAAVPA